MQPLPDQQLLDELARVFMRVALDALLAEAEKIDDEEQEAKAAVAVDA